jgi:hypothetical protein
MCASCTQSCEFYPRTKRRKKEFTCQNCTMVCPQLNKAEPEKIDIISKLGILATLSCRSGKFFPRADLLS